MVILAWRCLTVVELGALALLVTVSVILRLKQTSLRARHREEHPVSEGRLGVLAVAAGRGGGWAVVMWTSQEVTVG